MGAWKKFWSERQITRKCHPVRSIHEELIVETVWTQLLSRWFPATLVCRLEFLNANPAILSSDSNSGNFWSECAFIQLIRTGTEGLLLWGSVSAPGWGEENSTSGPGSSEGRSSLVPWFSRLLLLDVPGTATEQDRTCGFKRNSSSFDKASKMRDSVLLNSFENFLVTLPSISSETWEM